MKTDLAAEKARADLAEAAAGALRDGTPEGFASDIGNRAQAVIEAARKHCREVGGIPELQNALAALDGDRK